MHPATLTREQVRNVDRLAVEEFGMSSLVLMENAGRGCVDVMQAVGIAGPVVVCCGRGNNGGDGFVIARHLDLRGFPVRVVLCGDCRKLTGDAAANFYILQQSDIPIEMIEGRFSPETLQRVFTGADWVVDALLGTGSQGEPKPPMNQVIQTLNACESKKMAVDLPSGLDCDTGALASSVFRADHTCTFVAPKPGFYGPAAQQIVGVVHVLDIGAPRKLIERCLSQR
jgi:NAD(P)H-hydrate epimerase